mgnify:CR=1 FL=1
MSNTNKPKKVKIFKIHGLDSNEFLTLLLHLSTAPNNSHEKAYNSLIFANSFALFNDLRGLDVPKLNQLANLVVTVLKYVSMLKSFLSILQASKMGIATDFYTRIS